MQQTTASRIPENWKLTSLAVAVTLLATACFSEHVDVVEALRRGTVRIETEGKFRAQRAETQDVSSGSGFFVGSRGYIVTNNHVVGGSAIRKVYVSGEETPFNARLIAVSECSDLAVIKIEGTEHGGYPLEWARGTATAGTAVLSAGFPAETGVYASTVGVISDAPAAVDTPWASVQEAVFHNATIHPGNSGGPLVSRATGAVVGVNYAGISSESIYMAISANEARAIVDRLMTGNDVASIGVSAEVIFEDPNADQLVPLGIWVSSVRPGSVADKTGVKPGDIIVEIDGINVSDPNDSRNASLFNFCDVLRSNDPSTDSISIKVVRYDSLQICEGQINGKTLKAKLTDGTEIDCGIDNPDVVTAANIYDTATSQTGDTANASSGGTTESSVDLEAQELCLQGRVSTIDVDTYFYDDGNLTDGDATLGQCMSNVDDNWGEAGYVFELAETSSVNISLSTAAPQHAIAVTLVSLTDESTNISVENDALNTQEETTTATINTTLSAGSYLLTLDTTVDSSYWYYLEIN